MLINNISAHIAKHRASIDLAIKRVLDRSWLVLGPEVDNFEKSFASYMQVEYCRSVANGTDALELALRALEINVGDKVATVANAGMYACTALLSVGAEPVFMDVNTSTFLPAPSTVENAIALGAKAIVITHLYGRAHPDIVKISDLCQTAGVALVEDCAQAHGARIGNKKAGSFGDIGCFSFYPTKNLGALGDGGAIVCQDTNLAQKVTHLRQYGWSAKYQVGLTGARNSRLDEIQAAILAELLPHLDSWNEQRRNVASQYAKKIKHHNVIHPLISGDDYVAHLYVVRSPNRDSLRQHLKQLDIATDIHYPIPDHRQPVFGNRFADIQLPNTEQLAQEILTLPCYPEMSPQDIEMVIDAVNSWPNTGPEKGEH